ncbi:hypothetical protein Tco_0121239 [Tanacetum coccineum]
MRKSFQRDSHYLKEFIHMQPIFRRNILIETLKLSKSLISLKARWRFFLALIGMTSVFWMFHVSIFIPHEQLNSWGRVKLLTLNKLSFRDRLPPDFEDLSFAFGFVLSFKSKTSNPISILYGNPISNLID